MNRRKRAAKVAAARKKRRLWLTTVIILTVMGIGIATYSYSSHSIASTSSWVRGDKTIDTPCGQVEVFNETSYELDVELLRTLTSASCKNFIRPLRIFIMNYRSVGVRDSRTHFDAGPGGEPAVSYANPDYVHVVVTTGYAEEAERKHWDTLVSLPECNLGEMRVKPTAPVFMSHLLVHEFLGHALEKASLLPPFPPYTSEEECRAQSFQFGIMKNLGDRLLFRSR